MSSHHFVREGQEPALFIFEATNYSAIEGLLEWAPLVLVTADALEEVLLWGIKIDVVLAGQEMVEDLTSRLIDQAPVKVLATGDDWVESALLFLTSSGQNGVSIIANTFSERLREKIEKAPHTLQVNVNTGTHKWAFIQAGNFKKWYQGGAVIDFSDPSLGDKIKGLKKQKNGYELTEDQWVSIESPNPFWIGEFA
jgi:hypothetical protein